jgi:hypothetical protein
MQLRGRHAATSSSRMVHSRMVGAGAVRSAATTTSRQFSSIVSASNGHSHLSGSHRDDLAPSLQPGQRVLDGEIMVPGPLPEDTRSMLHGRAHARSKHGTHTSRETARHHERHELRAHSGGVGVRRDVPSFSSQVTHTSSSSSSNGGVGADHKALPPCPQCGKAIDFEGA